tara:strand:+ start:340 stop:786 length:447 start_codon:yes stop_codon:yes gene_type:complete
MVATTFQSSAWNRSAAALPMPEEAPVIRMVFISLSSGIQVEHLRNAEIGQDRARHIVQHVVVADDFGADAGMIDDRAKGFFPEWQVQQGRNRLCDAFGPLVGRGLEHLRQPGRNQVTAPIFLWSRKSIFRSGWISTGMPNGVLMACRG